MKAAIFDLDGTLLDSMGMWVQIDKDFLAKRGIQLTMDYFDDITTMGFEEAARYTIERFGFPETPQQIMEEWREMSEHHYRHAVELKPYVREYLQQLAQDGVRIAAATASERSIMLETLERHGILKYFETVVCVAEVGRGKGFPDIYEEVARQLDLAAADCMVFEDILAGIQGAKDGGFPAVGVYDEASAKDRAAMELLADRYIESFSELLASQ